MRVLHIVPGMETGAGTERSLAALAPVCVARGLEFHVAVLTDRHDLVAELVDAGAVFHDLSGTVGFARRVRVIRRLIREIAPDLVVAALFEAVIPTQMAVIGTRVPLLVTWANTHYGAERAREQGARRGRLAIAQAAEIVFGWLSRSRYHAVTAGVAAANSRSLLVPRGRVLVGERGRDPSRYRPLDREELSPGLSPSDGPRVLAIGRQERQKGYQTLLFAFDELARDDPSVVLYVAGRTGSSTPELTELRQRLASRDRIRFLGACNDIASLLSDVDVVVCSSWREGAAGALIEAMACGVPIVSVPLSGLVGVLVDGDNARVVDRDRLADGIAEVLGNPELRARLVAGGLRTFRDRFTTDAAAARMIEIYEAATAAGRPEHRGSRAS